MTASTAYIFPTLQEQWQFQQLCQLMWLKPNSPTMHEQWQLQQLIWFKSYSPMTAATALTANMFPIMQEQWQLQQLWRAAPDWSGQGGGHGPTGGRSLPREQGMGGEASWQLYLRSCTSGLNVVCVHGFFLFIQLAAPPVPLAQQGCHAEVLSYTQQARARQPTCSGKNRFFISDQPSCPQSSFVISITWWLST